MVVARAVTSPDWLRKNAILKGASKQAIELMGLVLARVARMGCIGSGFLRRPATLRQTDGKTHVY